MPHRILIALVIFGFTSMGVVTAQAQELLPKFGFKTIDQEIDLAVQKAEAAIRNCDEDSYENAIDWLDDIAYDASAENEDRIDYIIDGLDGRWNAAFPCGLKPRDNPYAVSIFSNIGTIRFSDAPAYLGKENGGMINTLRFIKPDRSASYSNVGAELRINLSQVPNWPNWPNMPNTSRKSFSFWDVALGFSRARADISDNFSNVGTGGDVLLVPGVGSGPNGAGFSLAFAGGLNTVTNAAYQSDYDWSRFHLGFGKNMKRNDVKIRPYAGLEYGRLNANQMFSGTIAGYARDFAYDTNIDSQSVSPFVGVEGAYRPKISSALPIELFGKTGYKLNYSFTEATDSLAFTGFNTQSIDVDKQEFSHDFSLGAGINFNPDGPISASLGVGYEHTGNVPVISRDGAGPSKISHRQSSAMLAAFDVKIKFQ